MDLNSTLKETQTKINNAIIKFLPPPTTVPTKLHQAIHYSMTGEGKRLRPTLLLMAYELFCPALQIDLIDPLPAAVAVECIHTSSLIHDDLPAMDNSTLRRGRPTCHKQFDEATAILAGDALLILPFHILAQYYSNTPPGLLADLIQTLARASGSERLIGGQAQDLEAEQKEKLGNKEIIFSNRFHGEASSQRNLLLAEVDDSDDLETIALNKTAALISASLYMGLRLMTDNIQLLSAIKNLGEHLGIAFQIVDDILDITSSPEALGKDPRDVALNKLTYPIKFGLEAAREKAIFHTEEALKITKSIGGKNTKLLKLIERLVQREC